LVPSASVTETRLISIGFYQPGFVKKISHGAILLYLFDSDCGAGGGGTKAASGRKNSGEKLF